LAGQQLAGLNVLSDAKLPVRWLQGQLIFRSLQGNILIDGQDTCVWNRVLGFVEAMTPTDA